MAEAYRQAQTPLLYPSSKVFSLQSVFVNLAAGHGLDKQQWNTLIGVVTAIIGNILISFALNIQRYAHIRLNHEEERWQSDANLGLENGAQYSRHINGANERSEPNTKASGVGKTSRDNPNEQTSLMNGNHTRKSNHSDDAADPSHSDTDEDSDVEYDDHHERSSYLRSPWWWAGIILMTVGEAGNFLA